MRSGTCKGVLNRGVSKVTTHANTGTAPAPAAMILDSLCLSIDPQRTAPAPHTRTATGDLRRGRRVDGREFRSRRRIHNLAQSSAVYVYGLTYFQVPVFSSV